MNAKNAVVKVALFLPAVFVGGQLAVRLPFIENWPYSWVVYEIVFASCCIFFAVRYRRPLNRIELSAKSALLLGLCLTLLMSAFLMFARSFVEDRYSYSFARGKVISKYRSSNHNDPALEIVTESGHQFTLDIPGQEELWQAVNVGDYLQKSFMNPALAPVAQHASPIE